MEKLDFNLSRVQMEAALVRCSTLPKGTRCAPSFDLKRHMGPVM
jgi:hypothetical protein